MKKYCVELKVQHPNNQSITVYINALCPIERETQFDDQVKGYCRQGCSVASVRWFEK